MTIQDVLLNGWLATVIIAFMGYHKRGGAADTIVGTITIIMFVATAIRQLIRW